MSARSGLINGPCCVPPAGPSCRSLASQTASHRAARRTEPIRMHRRETLPPGEVELVQRCAYAHAQDLRAQSQARVGRRTASGPAFAGANQSEFEGESGGVGGGCRTVLCGGGGGRGGTRGGTRGGGAQRCVGAWAGAAGRLAFGARGCSARHEPVSSVRRGVVVGPIGRLRAALKASANAVSEVL